MLNINKIHSLINSGSLKISRIAEEIEMPYSTLKSKLEADSWTPDDIEKLANFFKKPIAYFFDKEELPQVNEVDNNYKITQIDCPECVIKQKEIDRLNEKIQMQEELLSLYREKKSNGKCG